MVVDHRMIDTRPLKEVDLWLVATDRFLSGWGNAPDTSYVAYPVDLVPYSTLRDLECWMENRIDYMRVRKNCYLPRIRKGCHLSVYDIPLHLRK